REYAQEQLTQGGDGPQMHRRHADHFLGLAERAAAELSGERQLLSLDQLNREHANLRAALSWFRETGDPERKGLRMARALWRFWWLRSYSTEGRAQLAALLKLAGDAAPAPLRTQSLHGLGMLALRQGDTVEARDCLRSAFTVAEQADDRLDMAVALTGLGRLALDEGQVEEAHAYLERSLTLEREVLQGAGLGLTLTYLGWAAMFSGDHAKAHELLDEGLARFREVGDRDGEGRVLWSLGHLALECHELDRSRSFFLQAFRIDAELNYNHGLAIVLEGLADLAAAERSYERACRLAGSAAALRQAAGMVAPVEFKRRHERSIGAARAALDPDVAEARWFEGWNLSPDDILAEELAAAD
ncbi:MAG TPA: tetratricopeptide repeat protein, partial [Steroidobacteraceae bacterium]|nr:tetratricopeptide repeat protein [Steroidobacteraceae bacterium]